MTNGDTIFFRPFLGTHTHLKWGWTTGSASNIPTTVLSPAPVSVSDFAPNPRGFTEI